MSPIFSTSLSGMRSAQSALDASAQRIARAPVTVQAADAAVTEGDTLATDMVGQLVAKNAFLANLSVFKAADQMAGTLLDIRG